MQNLLGMKKEMKQNCEINEFQERTEKMKKIKKYIAVIPIALLFVLLTGIHVFGAETVLQQKKWVNDATFQSEADNTYYKINITKTGYIKAEYFLDREPEFTSNITLYDQNKKKLSKSSAMKKKHTAYWAVKKGTYYLRAGNESEYAGVGGTDADGDYSRFAYVPYNYKLRYTFKALKDSGKKATRMSKAPELKKGKTAQGLVFPKKKDGVKAVYKINIPKTGKVTFQFKLNSSYYLSPALQIRLYDAKGRMLTDGKYKKDMIYWYESGKSKVNLKAGTYYLGIYKFNSDGSGSYSIKWK